MTDLKRTLLFCLFTCVFLSIASGAVMVVQTVHEYTGVCSKLDGFPGLLQQAGLLQAGTCKGKPGGAVCNSGLACTVGENAGKCKNTGKPGGAVVCACVATVSQP
jgi:hypothetical protein